MTLRFIWGSLLITFAFISCSKSNKNSNSSDIKQDTINIESIIRVPPSNDPNADLDVNRKGFIDLYDGVAYSQAEAAKASNKIDFAYNYQAAADGCYPVKVLRLCR